MVFKVGTKRTDLGLVIKNLLEFVVRQTVETILCLNGYNLGNPFYSVALGSGVLFASSGRRVEICDRNLNHG